MTPRPPEWLAWTLLGLGIIAAIWLRGCPRAQAYERPIRVIIAQKCVQEVGWGHWDECTAVYQSLRNRAEFVGRSFREHARMYAHPARGNPRPWIPYLRGDLVEPHGWPRNLSWPRVYRSGWALELAWADTLLAGGGVLHCDSEPWDWAARNAPDVIARYRREYPRAVEIHCGDTQNRFFRPWP